MQLIKRDFYSKYQGVLILVFVIKEHIRKLGIDRLQFHAVETRRKWKALKTIFTPDPLLVDFWKC